jgi:hypothetical protein
VDPTSQKGGDVVKKIKIRKLDKLEATYYPSLQTNYYA